MSGFAPSGQTATGLDPRKRVNYQQGMVLGADEFMLDQFHHRSRDHHATRALHGYGTVSGLGLTVDGTEVRVAPGLAVDPAGRLICVPVEYCADLTAWINGRFDPDEVSAVSIPSSLRVHVSLCWVECETDEVPIPADSCLSAEDSRAASRIMDSFELRLSTEPTPLVGEVAPGSLDGMTQLVEEIHGLSDPSGAGEVDLVEVAELLREWAVERRPEIADDNACLGRVENVCVALGSIEVDIGEGGGGLTVSNPVVDDSERPILASTRLLQEIIFATGNNHEHTLGALTDVEIDGVVSGSVLGFDGTVWVPVAVGDGVTAHGDLTGLGNDDHPQYLLTDGSRALTGDLGAGGNRITNLADSIAAGQAIVHGQDAGGDLIASYPDPRIGRLQDVPVDARNPTPSDALLFDGAAWIPTRPTLLPLATIIQPAQRRWRLWFNIDAPKNGVEVADFREALTIMRERDAAPFLQEVVPEDVIRQGRNLFEVITPQPQRPARFIFLLERVELDNGQNLLEWSTEQRIWFCGQSLLGGEATVTIFVADSLRNAGLG